MENPENPVVTGCFHVLFRRSMYITLSIMTILVVLTLYNDFLNNPTLTSLDDSTFPVTNVPFPGISVCSLNKISKRKAEKFAERLVELTGKNRTVMMNYVRFIGQLYDFDFIPSTVDDLLEFQKILNNSGFKLTDVIKELAINCDELLESCMWQRVDVKCSEIFQMKLTHDGYCCVFTNNNSFHTKKPDKAVFTTEAGINHGLQIVVRNQLDDYFYSIISSIGITVQIFDSYDYPDKPSGNMKEILIENGSESFIEINPTTYEAVADVRDYPVEKRGCIFRRESPTIFGSLYSLSNCIVGCRIESALALCQCIPFKLPLSNESTVCTIEDIPCVHRYRDKWFTMAPDEDVQEHLPREQHDALRCSRKCYPKCSGTFYDVQINSFPLFNKTLVTLEVCLGF
ncbi:sodium channel protein Nach-like [Zophobas morio]|uniref:sodium channel protein Nach-like n=1 Tax=Zophobas morio TaxID=2755281 RepID=UPI00308366BA